MRLWIRVLSLLLLILYCHLATADEHRTIYVNNDSSTPAALWGADIDCGGGNCVSVFSLGYGSDELHLLHAFPTGGEGVNGGYVSSPRIAATVPNSNQGCLFVVNAATHDVSAFVYRLHANGNLKTVLGSPFVTGGRFGDLGGGLALSPDGQFLYTSNSGSDSISTFRVSPDCSLTLLQPIPTLPAPADLQVNADRSCLAVSSPRTNEVALYDVLQGFPQPVERYIVPGPGDASGVEFSSQLVIPKLYVAKQNDTQTAVVSYTVNGDCRLSDPAVFTSEGVNSAVAKLTPKEECLFVPNQGSRSMTTFSVDPATGDLTFVGTFPDFAANTAAVVFADGATGLNLFTNVFRPRAVARRNALPGCVPTDLIQQLDTQVTGPGGLLRSLVVAQEVAAHE